MQGGGHHRGRPLTLVSSELDGPNETERASVGRGRAAGRWTVMVRVRRIGRLELAGELLAAGAIVARRPEVRPHHRPRGSKRMRDEGPAT